MRFILKMVSPSLCLDLFQKTKIPLANTSKKFFGRDRLELIYFYMNYTFY